MTVVANLEKRGAVVQLPQGGAARTLDQVKKHAWPIGIKSLWPGLHSYSFSVQMSYKETHFYRLFPFLESIDGKTHTHKK